MTMMHIAYTCQVQSTKRTQVRITYWLTSDKRTSTS